MLALIICALGLSSCNSSNENGVVYRVNWNESCAEVVGFEGDAAQVVIQPSFNDYAVTRIAPSAFAGCKSIKSIVIPDSVESIGDSAFSGCENLESVTFGSSLSGIGAEVFADCKSLKSFSANSEYYASVDGNLYTKDGKTLVQYAIGKADTSFTIPNTVETVGAYAFYTCDVLESIKMSNSVKYVNGFAFMDCENLSEVTFSSLIRVIGESAFSSCDSLASISIPSNIRSIGYRAFSNCESLKSINFNTNSRLKSIGGYAFYDCDRLTAITVPDRVVSMDSFIFSDCDNLVSVSFGVASKLTEIGSYAFYNCTRLTGIEIPTGVKNIGPYTFYNCVSLESIELPCGVSEDIVTDDGEIQKGVPYGVTSIGGYAFYGCSSLESIELPYAETEDGETYGVTSVGEYAFYGCSSFKDMVMPQSVRVIGDEAFSQCTGVESIEIPTAVDSMGERVFLGCKSLTAISIPNGADSIGEDMFGGCTALASINIPASVTNISNRAFRDCESLEKIEVNERNANYLSEDGNLYTRPNNEGKALTKYATGKKNHSFTIPDGVAKIADEAFLGCTNLLSIEIPQSVDSVGDNAFSGCTRLSEVIYKSHNGSGDRLKIEIGTEGCGGVALNAIAVHTGRSMLVEQGGYVFYTHLGANYLLGYIGDETEIALPESYNGEVYKIHNGAFYNRHEITSIEVPDSVTNIGARAFYNCSGITSIRIPESVTGIGEEAFTGCHRLAEVINKSSLNIIKGSSTYGDVARYAFSIHSGGSKVVNEYDYLFYTYEGVNYLIGYVGDETVLVLPDGYKGELYRIYEGAFSGLSNITHVLIPACVTEIGYGAFYGCDSLVGIEIPFVGASYSATGAMSHLGYMFGYTVSSYLVNGYHCYDSSTGYYYTYNIPTALKTVYVSYGAKSISDVAFRNCDRLLYVGLPESVERIGAAAFSGCDSLEDLVVPFVGGTSDGASNSNFGYIFGDSNRAVPLSLKNVAISGGSSIAANAFAGCDAIVNIAIPASVTSIGKDAFAGCNSLDAVFINDLAAWCDISFGNSEANPMFDGCSLYVDYELVTELVIPNTVKSISDYAFYGFDSLSSIVIPKSVELIGKAAFFNCDSLDYVYYEGSKTEWKEIQIKSENDAVEDAKMYYYSETEPAIGGNLWHYDSDGNVEIWK